MLSQHQKIILSLIAGGVAALLLILQAINYQKTNSELPRAAVEPEVSAPTQSDEELIGGQRDEHDCLGPAGYTWDEQIGACTRSWELDEDQQQAAQAAVEYSGWDKSTVIAVESMGGVGNFAVNLEKGKDRVSINIENWQAEDKTLTPDDCTELGGRLVNITGGGDCDPDENKVGEVTGLFSKNICCVVQ